MMNIKHHGAIDGVTGSCHQLMFDDGNSLLIDCGMFQGGDSSPNGASQFDGSIDFSLDGVVALVCTHVHADHIARLPQLIAAGFSGPIYCSYPSAILLPDVLRESLKMAGVHNKEYIEAIIEKIEKQVTPLSYSAWTQVYPNVSIRLQPAGHILGSAFVECSILGKGRVVFSGDLGADDSALLVSPKSPPKADVLVLEGTYGDRNHDDRKQRRECLASTIERAVEDLGAVIIPAFSLGRTQELLYEIEAIITERVQLEEGRGAWSDLAVIVDSPLASKFTKIYRRLKPYWNDEAQLRLKMGRRPLNFSKMLIVDNHLAHERVVEHLRDTARPVIVISASGMCNGGRIVNYLKALLPDPRTDILFVGYQSSDSVGRDIQQGVKSILLDGDEVEVRAKVHTIKGFSAHTDQSGLRRFVKGIQDPPKEIRIVHGDDKAKLMLQNLLSQDLPAANVWVP